MNKACWRTPPPRVNHSEISLHFSGGFQMPLQLRKSIAGETRLCGELEIMRDLHHILHICYISTIQLESNSYICKQGSKGFEQSENPM